jgi:hypothetical protein
VKEIVQNSSAESFPRTGTKTHDLSKWEMERITETIYLEENLNVHFYGHYKTTYLCEFSPSLPPVNFKRVQERLKP